MRTALACEEECCGGGDGCDGVCGVAWRRGSQQKRRGEQKSRGQGQQEGAATKVTCGMIGAQVRLGRRDVSLRGLRVGAVASRQ